MPEIIQIIIAVVAIAIFICLLRPSKSTPQPDQIIDPDDPSQIGTLVGLMGGSIEDAIIAQYALKRFEEENGRKATVKDMGTVAGFMRSIR